MSHAATATAGTSAARSRIGPRQVVPLLLLPILIVNAISFIWPTLSLLRMSFNEPVAGGAIRESFTFATYIDVMTDPFYIELVWNSIFLCTVITVCSRERGGSA